MKVFLYCYPIQEYFTEGVVGISLRNCQRQGYDINRLNEIIDHRYRRQGYMIYWLFFSIEADREQPDRITQSPYIVIDQHDKVMASGVSFQAHTTQDLYPDSDKLITRLCQDRNPEQLVLGGFHQWDCVDRLAARAFARGLLTTVDEDTTELFFSQTSLLGPIPLNRSREEFGAMLIADYHNQSELEILEIMRQHRRSRPWLVQL
ncbi:MAG: hypothetical protein WEA04_03370 [Candidatus Andersenbacteria bacterium]